MSVMLVSLQMIADATKKAETFRNHGFANEEKMMCQILARMNKKDIDFYEENVKDFFYRLYRWNAVSFEANNNEELSEQDRLRYEFDESQKMAKDIDIYQFVMLLSFLDYNIEVSEVRHKNILSDDEMTQMEEDARVLRDMIAEINRNIVRALQEERKSQWFYY